MANRKRKFVLRVPVTPEERALIQQKMAQLGTKNFSAYARKMLIDGYIVHIDTGPVRAQTAELQKIGVNINQIARRINSTGTVYAQDLEDPHLKVLQAAHISDDEYFSQMVRDDLNLIIRDIREAHKKDSESAPQTTVADELKENLEAVENFKGSRDEKLVVLYCKQLGINYKNLSDEEFRWLIRILKKSKKMGTPISQRKKR